MTATKKLLIAAALVWVNQLAEPQEAKALSCSWEYIACVTQGAEFFIYYMEGSYCLYSCFYPGGGFSYYGGCDC